MRSFKFYKDVDDWFVDLPEWKGERWELQMVMGADMFLDILSQGEDEVYVTMSTEYFEGSDVLQFTELGKLEGPELGEGAWYFLNDYRGLNYSLSLWLCHVTTFVFNEYPNRIYFK
jgi:hypothetical protein